MKKKTYNRPVVKALSIGYIMPIATSETQTFNTGGESNQPGVRDSKNFTGGIEFDDEDTGGSSPWDD